MQNSIEQQRVIIRINVRTIPGNSQSRPFTVGEAFSLSTFKQSMRNEQSADGFDAVHIPPHFDTDHNVKVWFMYDFGVKHELSRLEVTKLPLNAYTAQYDASDREW